MRADREIKRLSKRKYGRLGEGCPNQFASQTSTLPVAFVDQGKFGKRWKARDRKLRTTSTVISRIGPLRRCLEDASEAFTIVS